VNLPVYAIESPDEGTIEEIYIEKHSYTYEWEKLFLLKTIEGRMVEVNIGASGNITSVQVAVGEKVNRHTLLASLQDDYIISGSD
jgi:hypothetical protein